ncbi:MAG TPA: hypothetical protein VKQ72_07830 [Aggregatilineales bacterium]|nr:hypothetical protein [Aggregatilineales bacterium]
MGHSRQHLFLLLVGILAFAVLVVETPTYAAPGGKPTATPTQPCYKPQSVTTQMSGYSEGSTGNQKSTITGKEIAYNLVTFQRETFSFKAQMSTSGRVLGSYVGYIQGFVTNQSTPTDAKTFNNQYDTQFMFNTEAANTTIWSGFDSLPGRQGTVHFSTSTIVTPQPIASVSGDQAYLVVANPPFSVGESGQSGYFFIKGSLKSYIVNCLVDIPTLVNDIQTGNGSTIFRASQNALVSPWRNAAAAAAQSAAQDYNNRVQTQTG